MKRCCNYFLFFIFFTFVTIANSIFAMQNMVAAKNASSIKRSPPSLKFLAAKASLALPHDRLPDELKEYVNIASIKDYRSCLIEACKKGNDSIIPDMICLGVNIDEKHNDNPQETPLAISAKYGHARCVELLLHHGARDKYTAALAAAVRHNKPQCIEVLCRNPEPLYLIGDCYSVGDDNPEALIALFRYLPSAAKLHNLQHAAHCYVNGNTNLPTCLALILDRGININATYCSGDINDWGGQRTFLMQAIRHRKIAIIELLLKRGADVNLRDSNGYKALMHLIVDRYYRHDKMEAFRKIITLLVQHGAQVLDQDLHQALASCTPDIKDDWIKGIHEITQNAKSLLK